MVILWKACIPEHAGACDTGQKYMCLNLSCTIHGSYDTYASKRISKIKGFINFNLYIFTTDINGNDDENNKMRTAKNVMTRVINKELNSIPGMYMCTVIDYKINIKVRIP